MSRKGEWQVSLGIEDGHDEYCPPALGLRERHDWVWVGFSPTIPLQELLEPPGGTVWLLLWCKRCGALCTSRVAPAKKVRSWPGSEGRQEFRFPTS